MACNIDNPRSLMLSLNLRDTLRMYKSFLPGNSAVGLAYKSGGLGVGGSNPPCPIESSCTSEDFFFYPLDKNINRVIIIAREGGESHRFPFFLSIFFLVNWR